MRHAQRTLVWALALLAIPILALAAVSRPQPYPGFWPSGQALRQSGFDYWRVWETRCAVRSTPTTAYTLLDRHAVLLMWINELRRQGYPVELTAPPNRLSKLAQLVKPSTVTEACQEVDSSPSPALSRGKSLMMRGVPWPARTSLSTGHHSGP